MLLLKELIALGPNWISVQIQLDSFLELQGRLVFSPFVAWQKKNLVSAQRGGGMEAGISFFFGGSTR